MSTFKFLHAADIHLDSPLRGLSRYEGVPAEEIRVATRTAFDNLIEAAIEQEVAFAVIAGDLYDGDWTDFGTGLYFCTAMGRLERAGIDVFLLFGNHDAESVLTKRLPLPKNVKVFNARVVQTFIHEGSGAVLHGQSYREPDTRDNLAAGYPEPRPNSFNIGVLHTALTGRPPHAPYAPCSPQELIAKGYDYWALGHVHDFEIVSAAPMIVYPGNLQGRNIRETGPKGSVIVTVKDGAIVGDPTFVDLDVVRWARIDVDCTAAEADSDVQARIRTALQQAFDMQACGRPLMVRIALRGATSCHGGLCVERQTFREDVRAIAVAISDRLWVEKVVISTQPVIGISRLGPTINEELQAILAAGVADPELMNNLRLEFAEFFAKIPPVVGSDDDYFRQLRLGDIDGLLKETVPVLERRLSADGK